MKGIDVDDSYPLMMPRHRNAQSIEVQGGAGRERHFMRRKRGMNGCKETTSSGITVSMVHNLTGEINGIIF